MAVPLSRLPVCRSGERAGLNVRGESATGRVGIGRQILQKLKELRDLTDEKSVGD